MLQYSPVLGLPSHAVFDAHVAEWQRFWSAFNVSVDGDAELVSIFVALNRPFEDRITTFTDDSATNRLRQPLRSGQLVAVDQQQPGSAALWRPQSDRPAQGWQPTG